MTGITWPTTSERELIRAGAAFVASNMEEKVRDDQTQRVVLNLADSPVSPADMRRQLGNWPVPGLQEVVAVDRDGRVVRLYP